MFAIIISDTSEIQVYVPFFLMLNRVERVIFMRKNEKCLHRIIYQLLLVIFILLIIIIFK